MQTNFYSEQNMPHTESGAEKKETNDKNFASSISSVVKKEIYPLESNFLVDNGVISNVVANEAERRGHIITDPNGSYTGTPTNPYEAPVQDVDDL